MPKMARNRSALHDVLAQGASNRDITVDLGQHQRGWHLPDITLQKGAYEFNSQYIFKNYTFKIAASPSG